VYVHVCARVIVRAKKVFWVLTAFIHAHTYTHTRTHIPGHQFFKVSEFTSSRNQSIKIEFADSDGGGVQEKEEESFNFNLP